MKYTTDEAMKEIDRRGRIIRQKHERKVTRLLSSATLIVAFALVGTLSVLNNSAITQTQSSYGSFLLPASSGIYILVAVLAFVSGVAITLIIQRYRKRMDELYIKNGGEINENEKN